MPSRPSSGFGFILRFAAFFLALQVVVVFALGDAVQPFMIEQATVRPGVPVIRALYPGDSPLAIGDTIRSSAVSMKVLQGCEGTEFYLLLAAAILAFSASWQQKLVAMCLGLGLVFALNQARLVVLYAVARDHREVFQLVHVYFAPLVFVAVIALMFSLWSSRALRSPQPA